MIICLQEKSLTRLQSVEKCGILTDMDTFLYINGSPETTFRKFADKAGWRTQVVTSTTLNARQVSRLLDFWQPAGVYIDLAHTRGKVAFEAFGKTPLACFAWDAASVPSNVTAILYDSYGTGRLGARELLSLEPVSFAYVHPPDEPIWSRDREAGFCDALKLNGCKAEVFHGGRTGIRYQKPLQNFLKKLPKPCAIMAANDSIGANILNIAGKLGLAVPDELAVLGVDDIAGICEHTHPKLSSIRPNFPRGTELAIVALLARRRRQKRTAASRRFVFGPIGVTHRASTRLLRQSNAAVAAALNKIADEACTGLRARDVVKLFPCARPVAEARFRKATGHSILEEIHAVRLNRLKEMLSNPSVQLKSLPRFCGFQTINALCSFFHRQTGMTMSAWRKSLTKRSRGS